MNVENKSKVVIGALALLASSLGITTFEQPANALPAVQSTNQKTISVQQKSSQWKNMSIQQKAMWMKTNQLKSNMLKSNQDKGVPVSTQQKI